MLMTTVSETSWDLIAAETNMPVRLSFFSNTNLVQAKSELELLDLDTLKQDSDGLTVDGSEFFALEEPIMVIVEAWGGTADY